MHTHEGRDMEQRYCKFCGGMINSDKVCESCGHKFFKIRINTKFKMFISILITLMVLCGFSYMGYIIYDSINTIEIKESQIRSQNETITKLNKELSDATLSADNYKKSANKLIKQVNDLTRKNEKYLEDLNWYEKYVAITTETGDCYHTIGCPYIKDSDVIYVQYYLDAMRSGYKACSYCKK